MSEREGIWFRAAVRLLSLPARQHIESRTHHEVTRRIEHHLWQAQELARWVDEDQDFERLAMEEVRQQLVQYTVPAGYLGKGDGR